MTNKRQAAPGEATDKEKGHRGNLTRGEKKLQTRGGRKQTEEASETEGDGARAGGGPGWGAEAGSVHVHHPPLFFAQIPTQVRNAHFYFVNIIKITKPSKTLQNGAYTARVLP